MPAEGITQISRPLSDLSLAYSNPASIAEGVFPRKTVMVQKGKIYILKPENLRKVKTGPRAYGEPAARSHWVSEPVDFVLDHHSLYDTIDVNQKAYGMDQPLNPKKAMTLTLTGQLMISKEHDAVDKCFKASAFNTGYHATPTTKWDATGGDPIGEINDASQKVLLGCGMRANAVAIASDVWTKLISLEPIVSRFKYVQTGTITEEMFATLFPWLDAGNVFIGDMVNNTANEKADDSYGANASIWSTNMLVFRREAGMTNSPMDEPLPIGFGRSLGYERSRYVREYMTENPLSENIYVGDDWDNLVTEQNAGYLITSPMT